MPKKLTTAELQERRIAARRTIIKGLRKENAKLRKALERAKATVEFVLLEATDARKSRTLRAELRKITTALKP